MQKLLLLRVLLSSKTRSVFRVLSSKTCFVNHWAAWLYFVNFQVVVFCILLIFQVVYFVNFCILLILQHIINSAPGLCNLLCVSVSWNSMSKPTASTY